MRSYIHLYQLVILYNITCYNLGLWPENADGTEVNACDRNRSKNLLASGAGCAGEVKVFQYPCFQPKVFRLYSSYPIPF